MSKYDVTHACGHTVTHNLVGPTKDRGPRADWLASKQCYDCAKAADVDAARSEVLTAFGPLPDLQGSEKQVAWADKLRVTMLNKVVDRIKTAKDYNPDATFKAPNAVEMARRVKLANDAKFWIDNRDNAKWAVALPQ